MLVVHGDTAVVPYGIGTFGSRSTAVGGTALYLALQDLKEKIKKFGAALLECEDVSEETPTKYGAGTDLDVLLGAAELYLPIRRAYRGH